MRFLALVLPFLTALLAYIGQAGVATQAPVTITGGEHDLVIEGANGTRVLGELLAYFESIKAGVVNAH